MQVQRPSLTDTDLARDLREAFLGEVRTRLPRLVDGGAFEDVRRDVHTLASSAWVVGEVEICRSARAAEADLRPATLAPLVDLLHALLDHPA